MYTIMSRALLSIASFALAIIKINTTYANTSEQQQQQQQQQKQHCEPNGICTLIKTDQVPEPCIDQSIDIYGDILECKAYASEGECRKNADFMLNSCPRSCLSCPPRNGMNDEDDEEYDEMMELSSGGEQCSDFRDRCGEWAMAGECVLNPEWMVENCRDSCYMCWNGPVMRKNGQPEDLMKRKKIYRTLKLGIPQKIVGNDEDEILKTKQQMVAMDRYAKDEITIPSFRETNRSLCYNSIELCSYYASKGMCRSQVVFMINTCPLACMLCHVNDQFHRCAGKRSSHSIPSVIAAISGDSFHTPEDGDGGRTIDSIFQEFKQSGIASGEAEMAEGQASQAHFVVSKDDSENPGDDAWVVMFDNFLADEETNALVALGNEIGWGSSTLNEYDSRAGMHGVSIPHRSSKSAHCSCSNDDGRTNTCAMNNVHTQVVERISKLMNIPSNYFEPMELVRYGINDSYGAHHDYRLHDMWKPAGPRVFSLFLTLSDVTDDEDISGGGGGQIGFPGLDWTLVGSKRGQMLLWPNVSNDDPTRVDGKMVNEALPIKSGEKFGAHLYIHLHDWNDAHARGCT